MKKQLLMDYVEFDYGQINKKSNSKLLSEAYVDDKGILKVRGLLQKAEEKNQNNRIYPKELLVREAKKFETLISQRRSLGELDHPERASVNLGNVSHLITKIWWQDNGLFGEAEILPTPSGNILRKLFESKVNVGISSRGLGSLNEESDGILRVQDDFNLITWDFVSDPSTYGAFMKEVNESKNVDPKLVCKNKVQCLIYDILEEIS